MAFVWKAPPRLIVTFSETPPKRSFQVLYFISIKDLNLCLSIPVSVCIQLVELSIHEVFKISAIKSLVLILNIATVYSKQLSDEVVSCHFDYSCDGVRYLSESIPSRKCEDHRTLKAFTNYQLLFQYCKFIKVELAASGKTCANATSSLKAVSRYNSLMSVRCDLKRTIKKLKVS
jgi:hypothetical protein